MVAGRSAHLYHIQHVHLVDVQQGGCRQLGRIKCLVAAIYDAGVTVDALEVEQLVIKQVGEMLREWEKKFPGRVENMFTALQNVVPSHLLDGGLYDFKNTRATGIASEDGDKAFDKEEFAAPSPSLPGVQVVQLS